MTTTSTHTSGDPPSRLDAAAAIGGRLPLAAPADLRRRVADLIPKLKQGLFERDEAIRLCLLTSLAGESIFLLGPPGVAKSLIARRLKHVFPREAKTFEYLMNRFSTPDEIFGPVSIKSLKKEQLRRVTTSYLPEATVVFLDEIWKAGPSIQNTLLTVLNEGIFLNGGVEEEVKLRALLSASNELPAAGQGLGALWDRFLVRLVVDNVRDSTSRRQLILGRTRMADVDIADNERFLDSEFDWIDEQIDRVVIPDEVLDVFDVLVELIAQYNVKIEQERSGRHNSHLVDDFAEDDEGLGVLHISDRRWKKIGRLLRTAALGNGREEVELSDCFLMPYCLWNEEAHRSVVSGLVMDALQEVLVGVGRQVANEWKSIRTGFDQLAYEVSNPPLPFEKYYHVDLSDEVGSRLKNGVGKRFIRLHKIQYEKLGTADDDVILYEAHGRQQVKLRGRRGETPTQIILSNASTSERLGSFPATVFRLIGDSEKEIRKLAPESWQQLEKVRLFLSKVNARRRVLHLQKRHLDEEQRGNLFLSLTADRWMLLADALGKTERKLVRLAKQVRAFLNEHQAPGEDG